MTPNSHQNLEIILIEKYPGIKPMGLSAKLGNYKNQDCFRIFNHQQMFIKVLTQWDFVPLGPTLIYTAEEILPTLSTKP